MFRMDPEKEFSIETLENFIKKHKSEAIKLRKKMDMYKGNHDILNSLPKEAFKPDNRLVVNFAKYIVDTFNGFFMGIPVKVNHESDKVSEYLELLDGYNDQDDNNAELSKLMSIYGHAFELLFIDEDGQVGITYVSPEEAFIVYDDSIRRNPIYGVRYFINQDNILEGSYSDAENIYYFKDDGGLKIVDEEPHYFNGVPLIEYVENEERQGIFDNVTTLINEYNKAISEKANDVDYYADAYLLILGALLEDKDLERLRDNRILNMATHNDGSIRVEFLSKPANDDTQENLINRLEKLIFQISMVANINDEKFGEASGISLKYKLQSMLNMAAAKERKFTSGMNRRYKLIANIPTSGIGQDEWMSIKYKFTRNMPANILEETEIAQGLSGIVSDETQLSVLSIVDNVKEELELREKEKEDATTFIYEGFNSGLVEDDEISE